MSNPKPRSAYTLVEMIATLTVLLVLGMSAAKLLTSITQIGLNSNERKTSIAMIQRLSMDFRNDIANAETMSIGEKAESIDLVAGESTIRYEFDKATNAIVRKAHQLEQESPSQIEQYKLTARCQPRFVSDDKLVTLRLTPQELPNPWTIEAAKP